VSSPANGKAHFVLLSPHFLAATSGPEWACAAGRVAPTVADILDFQPTSITFGVAANRRLAEELSTRPRRPPEPFDLAPPKTSRPTVVRRSRAAR
jgi:hypothetical protein